MTKKSFTSTAPSSVACSIELPERFFCWEQEKASLNILLGSCVRHNAFFLKYAKADNTVLAAKGRVPAHNPLVAIYQYDCY